MNKSFVFTKSQLDEEIMRMHEELATADPTSEDYEVYLARLKELYYLKKNSDNSKVSPDTIAVVLGNLLGILAIVNHERLNVVTSKALGFVLRGRV